MQNELNEKNVFGTLIRINREKQNLNLKTLAELSGISSGQLSKIERGIETATNNTLSYIFEALDIDFNTLKKEIYKIKDNFQDFYERIFHYESKENVKVLIDEINTKYQCEFHTTETLLINLIYNLTFDKNYSKAYEIINLLFNVLDYMSLLHKQIFYDYCGVYYRQVKRVDKSIYYLNQSLTINYNKMVTGMAYYHLGISYRKNHQILKSYNCMNNAKSIFFSLNNYKRSTMADLVIANIHSTNGEYQEALELLNNCIANYKRLNLQDKELVKIYNNILWIQIISEDFDKALETMNFIDSDYLSAVENDETYLLYKVILCVQYENYPEALSLCSKIKRIYHEDNIDHNFIMYYFYLIKNDKTKRMKHLNKIKILIDQSSSYIDYRFLFKLLDKESITNNQLLDFKNLLMKYIFNSFNQ